MPTQRCALLAAFAALAATLTGCTTAAPGAWFHPSTPVISVQDPWWSASGCQALDNGRLGATQVARPSFGTFQGTFARLVREATSS